MSPDQELSNNSGPSISNLVDNKVIESYFSDLILQVDGNDSLDDDFDEFGSRDIAEIQSNDRNTEEISSEFIFENNDTIAASRSSKNNFSSATKTASFTLIKEKQTNSIGADTNLSDFNITINDNDKNVNIQCSTAFYDAVAKPVMSGLSKDSSLNLNNISVNCTHIDYNRDTRGHEYNRVLHISLGGDGQFNIGKVTIHLHHTKRLLQLQGSATMPDGTRAPVWFVNTFIKERFTRAAKLKHRDISYLNDAIRKAVASQNVVDDANNNCSHCTRQFSANAKPTMCKACAKFFHKYNCHPVHTAKCKSGDSSLASLATASPEVSPGSSPAITTAVSPLSLPAPPNLSVSSSSDQTNHPSNTPKPPSPSPVTVNPSKRRRAEPEETVVTLAPSLVQTLTVLNPSNQIESQRISPPSAITAVTSPESSLNINAPSFISSATSSLANSIPKKKTKPTAKTTPISPETARINYLNLEQQKLE